MTRPNSHQKQNPAVRCGNCQFGHWIPYKGDLLCFHNDSIQVESGVEDVFVYLNDRDVSIMGEEYDEVWAGRTVHPTDVCDEWAPKCFVINGKTFRLACLPQDIGKEVYVSDESPEHAAARGMKPCVLDVYQPLLDEPYRTTNDSWYKFAVIEVS